MEEALRPGLIVVSHGTGDPGENRKIAAHLAQPNLGGRPDLPQRANLAEGLSGRQDTA
jgi:hypothetical protein